MKLLHLNSNHNYRISLPGPDGLSIHEISSATDKSQTNLTQQILTHRLGEVSKGFNLEELFSRFFGGETSFYKAPNEDNRTTLFLGGEELNPSSASSALALLREVFSFQGKYYLRDTETELKGSVQNAYSSYQGEGLTLERLILLNHFIPLEHAARSPIYEAMRSIWGIENGNSQKQILQKLSNYPSGQGFCTS